jgi:hypothetical protein
VVGQRCERVRGEGEHVGVVDGPVDGGRDVVVGEGEIRNKCEDGAGDETDDGEEEKQETE